MKKTFLAMLLGAALAAPALCVTAQAAQTSQDAHAHVLSAPPLLLRYVSAGRAVLQSFEHPTQAVHVRCLPAVYGHLGRTKASAQGTSWSPAQVPTSPACR